MQVYHHLDIGSAKASAEFMERVPHHLIDILDPKEQFSAGDFLRMANPLIEQILARGNWPLISGGTAFYIQSFLYGLPAIPQLEGCFRAELEKLSAAELYEELRRCDPESAQRLLPTDRQRLQRALEVYRELGRSLSSFPIPTETRPELDYLLLGLDLPRPELYANINFRVEEMFRSGLQEEVCRLAELGYEATSPGLQAIGYREFAKFAGSSEQQIMEKIQQNTRHFAKRQLTFMRKLPEIKWFHPRECAEISQLLRAHFS